MSEKPSLLSELKRRNVYKVAVAYAVVGWLLIQAGSILFPTYDAPAWAMKVFVALIAAGFPVGLVLAWAFEMTPRGITRTADVGDATSQSGGRVWIYVVIVGSVATLGLFFLGRYTAGFTTRTSITADKSIAVLPLVNQSGDPAQEYFSDGLTEELINVLGQVRELRVIGRNSSFRFKGKTEDSRAIGEALRVANVLEGSVRKSGDRVRISVQLVDAANESQRWSQSYDRELKDIFAVQEEIAKSVAEQLRVTLLGSATNALARPSNVNLDAYNAYLQGKFHFAQRNAAGDAKALASFEEAIRLDPNYAEAYLAMSRCHSSRAFFQGVKGKEEYELARQAVLKAVALKPGLAEAHAQLAYYLEMVDWDYAAAERELALAPGEQPIVLNMQAGLHRMRGDPRTTAAIQRKIIDLDPEWVPWYTNLASTLTQLGQYDETELTLRKAMELQPGAQNVHSAFSLLALLRGQPDIALREAQLESPGIWREMYVALAQHALGDHAAADAALDDLITTRGDSFPLQIALVYAGRRETEKVFEWLDRAYAARQPLMPNYVVSHALLKPYHSDPRFVEFGKKIGVTVPK